MLDRGVRIALIQLRVAEIVVGVGMVWPQAQHVEKIFFSFGEFAAFGEQVPKTVQGFEVIGIERDRLAIRCDGAVCVPLQPIRVAEIVVIIGGARIASDRGTNEALGLDVVPILLSGDAEQVQGFGVIRFRLQYLAIACFGFDEIPGLVV